MRDSRIIMRTLKLSAQCSTKFLFHLIQNKGTEVVPDIKEWG